MSAPGQGGEAAQQGQQGEAGENGQQAGPDYAALSGQLEQLVGGQEELRQFLSSEPWKQQAESEAEQQTQQTPDVDLSFLDPADPNYDPDQFGPQLAAAMRQEIQRAQQETQTQVQQIRDEIQQEREYTDLVNEFPEVAENAQEILQAAGEYAEANGIPPEIAQRAGYVRIFFLAGRAMDAAQNEGSGDPGVATVEGGGGPGAGASQPDPVDAILKPGGKRGASVLDF
jgi:hypothetical protein